MECNNYWNIIFSGLTAVGTVGAVIVALFRERIIDFFKPIKVDVIPLEVSMICLPQEGTEELNTLLEDTIAYLNLKITNTTKSTLVENCNVNLIEFGTFNSYIDNKSVNYSKEDYQSIRPFEFSPADNGDEFRSFVHFTIVDFIRISKQIGDISLCLRNRQLINYTKLKKGTNYKFTIEVIAKNITTRQIFEVLFLHNNDWFNNKEKQRMIVKKIDSFSTFEKVINYFKNIS